MEILMGDYVICTISDKTDKRYFNNIRTVEDTWYRHQSKAKYIIEDAVYYADEIKLAYEDLIQDMLFKTKGNELLSVEIPTIEQPWYIIHMSKCTLSGHVDMSINDIEVPDIIHTTFDGSITAEQVKKLRDLTKRGIMECKIALQDAKGDMKEAEKIIKIRR